MKTMELKKRLIREINQTTNKELLAEFSRFFNIDNEPHEIYQLSEEQKLAIAEGRNQIKRGEFLTNEQANEEIEQWLNQKSKPKR